MQNLRAPKRRKQNSSCDGCRRARVACDASDLAGQSRPGTVQCSRCSKLKRGCTFNWLAAVQRRVCDSGSRVATDVRTATVPTPSPLPYARGSPTATAEYGDRTHIRPSWSDHAEMSLMLQELYLTTFDRVFTGWVSSVCNNTNETEPTSTSYDSSGSDGEALGFFDLCVKLDCEQKFNEQGPGAVAPEGRQALWSSEEQEIRSIAIAAIHCFCVRWLPILHSELRRAPLCAWHEHLLRFLWRKARRLMLKAVNIRSYLSIFSLILFGLTPVPVGVGKAEEAEGLPGSLCFQVALQHLYNLRSRCRTLKFSQSKVMATEPTYAPHASNNGSRVTHYRPSLYFENMLYSAGMIIDTAASLTLDSRPSLAAGILGIDKELFFEIIKTRALITHERWQKGLLLQASKIGDAEADEIIMSTGPWKLYFWKTVAVLKEGLRDGCSEDLVQTAFGAVLDAIERFRLTYNPMMEACMRRLDFLSFRQRFDCWLLMCHWYLGILLLVDAVEVSGRSDLLSYLDVVLDEAVQGAIHGFKVGSSCKYMFPNVTNLDGGQPKVVQCALLAIDPYPVHVVATCRLVLKTITREHGEGKISDEAYAHLLDTILNALEQLPRMSGSVEMARQHIRAVRSSLLDHLTGLPNTTDDALRWQDAGADSDNLSGEYPSADFPIVDDNMEEYVTLINAAGQEQMFCAAVSSALQVSSSPRP